MSELVQFRPRRAVKLLSQREKPQPPFLRQWTLSRLLAWTVLDQRKGRRGRSPKKIKTKNAKNAGHLVLMSLLAHGASSEVPSAEALKLFFETGGFTACRNTPSAKALLKRMVKVSRKQRFVYQIVDYMCRYKLHEEQIRQMIEQLGLPYQSRFFSIDSAKSFIDNSRSSGPRKGKSETSNISKLWETYKSAAPYIYAFHPFLIQRTTPDEAFEWLAEIAEDQPRLLQLLGAVAFASDVLKERKVRNVRVADFKGLPRSNLRRRSSPPMKSISF